MRTYRIAIAALLAAASFAAPAAADPFFDATRLPAPPVPGKEIADDTAAFSTEYAHRIGGFPTELMAAAFLDAEAKKLGYQSEILTLPVAQGDPGTIGRAVVATRKGATKPDEHILFMGHYDVVPQTINGAYDNASGTNMIRALAKSMATVPTNHTISFIWYSNEEQGLLASKAHAKQAAAAGMKVKAVLGFDMVGIAYPVAAPKSGRTCLCLWHGEEDEDLEALIRHVNFKELGFPEADGLVQFQGVNQRNSDERSWDVEGYKVLRWAGMPTAATYPAYHKPDDTMARIDEVAGGRQYFEAGLRNTLVSAYTTALTLDNAPPRARATAAGSGPAVSFDGSGSSDPDGPIASYAWDFGDGSTGTGATATHTYSRPGTYAAKLTVTDNLHGSVTHATIVPVKVVKGAATVAKKKTKKKSCKRPSKRASAKTKRAYRKCLKRKKKRNRKR